MPCIILVSNKSGLPKGEIVSILDDSHVFSAKESMQVHKARGGSSASWGRTFSSVIVNDKTKEELFYLLDGNDEAIKKYHFVEPDKTNPLYVQLFNNGQVSADFNTVNMFIVERV